jgi:hypothetical protein
VNQRGRVKVETTPVRWFPAYATRPYDGDSLWVMADTGFDGRHEPELRLASVLAPELDRSDPGESEPGAVETAQHAHEWIDDAKTSQPDLRWYLYVETVKTKTREPGQRKTLDRYVAWVWRMDQAGMPGMTMNDEIIKFLEHHPDWGPGRHYRA